MTLKHFGPEHEWAVVQQQAQQYWNSPWAMVSQWHLGDSHAVYVYENNDDIVVNLNVEGIPLSDLSIDIDDSHLHLTAHHDAALGRSEEKVVVPFPFHVDPDTADAVMVQSDGSLELKVRRQVSPGPQGARY